MEQEVFNSGCAPAGAVLLSSPSTPAATLTHPLPAELEPPVNLTLVVFWDSGTGWGPGMCINGQRVVGVSGTSPI